MPFYHEKRQYNGPYLMLNVCYIFFVPRIIESNHRYYKILRCKMCSAFCHSWFLAIGSGARNSVTGWDMTSLDTGRYCCCYPCCAGEDTRLKTSRDSIVICHTLKNAPSLSQDGRFDRRLFGRIYGIVNCYLLYFNWSNFQ